MLLNLTASIPLLENLSLKNWRQDSKAISVICGGLKEPVMSKIHGHRVQSILCWEKNPSMDYR
jgi:hypothetical protein